MEAFGTLIGIWFGCSLIGSVLSAPILYVGRKRIGWAHWQYFVLVAPFLVWVALMLSPLATGQKSIANLGEPIYISFAMPIMAAMRVALGRRITERTHAIIFLTALCLVAAVTFFVVPFKPE